MRLTQNPWRIAGITALALAIVVGTMTATRAATNLSGSYDCIGQNEGGGSYKATVKITKSGQTYNLQWTIGGRTHLGVGFVEGNLLCCSWATGVEDKIMMGAVVYKIAGNKLVGRWTQYPGNGKILTETLTKQ